MVSIISCQQANEREIDREEERWKGWGERRAFIKTILLIAHIKNGSRDEFIRGSAA